jgi:hypothetical protein
MVVQLGEGDTGVGADKGSRRPVARSASDAELVESSGCGCGAVQGRRHLVDTEGEGGRWLGGAPEVRRRRAQCCGQCSVEEEPLPAPREEAWCGTAHRLRQ